MRGSYRTLRECPVTQATTVLPLVEEQAKGRAGAKPTLVKHEPTETIDGFFPCVRCRNPGSLGPQGCQPNTGVECVYLQHLIILRGDLNANGPEYQHVVLILSCAYLPLRTFNPNKCIP